MDGSFFPLCSTGSRLGKLFLENLPPFATVYFPSTWVRQWGGGCLATKIGGTRRWDVETDRDRPWLKKGGDGFAFWPRRGFGLEGDHWCGRYGRSSRPSRAIPISSTFSQLGRTTNSPLYWGNGGATKLPWPKDLVDGVIAHYSSCFLYLFDWLPAWQQFFRLCNFPYRRERSASCTGMSASL